MSRASHYIPKFLLRRFALSKASAEQLVDRRNLGQKHVWVFHKPSGKWAIKPVKRAATLPDFYDPDPALKIEEVLAEIEGLAAPVIDRIVSYQEDRHCLKQTPRPASYALFWLSRRGGLPARWSWLQP
jgi:hypothetical protein